MVKWLHQSKENRENADITNGVVDGIKKLYRKHILPVEDLYGFQDFASTPLSDSDFEAKPQVLLCGQYSVGKTSFIQFLLDREFPGSRVGPEPTTDRFTAVMHGNEDRIIPGNALAMEADKPFRALQRFGTSFLSKFEGAYCDSPVLQQMTIIDTPGVLAGEKQRIGRAYDFPEVVSWFSERADLIILLFDAHKLDISDEFKRAIETLKGQDDKIRVVLNKADMVSNQQLMRVYGALMWSLGKVFNTPEVIKVYVGSFWEKPYANLENKLLFDAEKEDLFKDLRALGKNSAIRKVNELVKRTRYVKVHALIVSHLRSQMPMLLGKDTKKASLIENLEDEFEKIKTQYRIPKGDFPNVTKYKERLKQQDFSRFAKLDVGKLKKMDDVLSRAIPDLVAKFPSMALEQEAANPFGEEMGYDMWAVSEDTQRSARKEFHELGPDENGQLSGNQCKPLMQATGLPATELFKLWNLSDVDQDGHFDIEEFTLMRHLCEMSLIGEPLPDELPVDLLPPSKRDNTLFTQR